MHRWFLFVLAAVTLIGVQTSTAAPRGGGVQDRFCLQGRIWGYPGNCQFSSYRQCMATADGTNAYCGPNPRAAHGLQRRR